jgi:hypothetical protein
MIIELNYIHNYISVKNCSSCCAVMQNLNNYQLSLVSMHCFLDHVQ